MPYVVDKQRNELFRKLVRAVVVGAVGYDGGHSVGIMKGTYKMVTAGFTGAVRAVRRVGVVSVKNFCP